MVRNRENGYCIFNNNDLFNLFWIYLMMILTVHSILVEVFSESLFELLTFGIFLSTLLFKYFS